jgi:Spy/CpxP family protein refolding chaperone
MKPAIFAALLAVGFAAAPARAVGVEAGAPDWKEKLGFTDAQAQKYAAAEKSKEDALRPLRAQLRDAVIKIQEQVGAAASESEIKASLERLAQLRGDISAANRTFDAELASFLAPSQRAKLLVGLPLGAARPERTAGRTAVVPRAEGEDELE